MKNLKRKRLNPFEPKIACYMQVSLRFHSGTIISTFLMKFPATFRTTCIYVNVNYISLCLCEFTHLLYFFFSKFRQHIVKTVHMDFQTVLKCSSPITFRESNISRDRGTDASCELTCYRQIQIIICQFLQYRGVTRFILGSAYSTDKQSEKSMEQEHKKNL